MRTTIRNSVMAVLLGAVSMFSAVSCQASILDYSPGVPRVPAPRTYDPPQIDGKLDDACWTKASQTSNFITCTSGKMAEEQTTAYLAFDKNNLYVAIRCKDSHPDKIVSNVAERDGSVWQDDSVELFIDPGYSQKKYFHLAVNSAGVQYDSEKGPDTLGSNWNGTWQAKTSIGKDEWTCEMAIPFNELKMGSPKPGTIWGFNVLRNLHESSLKDRSSNWAGIIGDAHQPDKLGEMVFTERSMGIVSTKVGDLFYGSNPLNFKIYNHTPYTSPVSYRVEVGSEKDLKYHAGRRLMLKADETQDIDLRYEVKDGDYLVISLFNDETGEVYQRERYSLLLPDPSIHQVEESIGSLEAATKRIEKRNPKLAEKLKTTTTGYKQKLTELEQAVDGCIKTQTVLDQDKWKTFQTGLQDYQQKVRSFGSILWTQNPWISLMPEDLPNNSDDLSEINLTLFVDEYKSSVFQITNLLDQDFKGRVVLENDLKDNSGNQSQLGREHVIIRNVDYRTLRNGGVVPDALPRANEGGEFRVDTGKTSQVWLTIDSKDATPGYYTGKIRIKPDSHSFLIKDITLNLTILPIQLPHKMPIATYNWDYAWNEAAVQDLSDHFMNCLLLDSPLPELDKDANIIKSGDYNSSKLQICRNYGQLVYSYGIVRDYNTYVTNKFGWSFMDDKWKKGFKSWVQEWMGALKAIGIGYNDFSVQIWDEPGGDDVDKAVKGGAFLREIDPNIRTVMDLYINKTTYSDMKRMAPYIDIWIPLLTHIQKQYCSDAEEELKFLKGTGKPVWTYTCSHPMAELSPIGYYRLKPWYCWDMKLDGCCFWAYNSWRGDSWDDLDGSDETDNGVVYYGQYGPVTSRRWEATREGMEDYLYLYLLNKAIEKGKSTRIDMNTLLAAQNVLNSTVPSVLAGAEKDPSLLDTARSQITDQILALNQKMPFVAHAPSTESHDADIVVKWDTNEPCIGSVYYREHNGQAWRVVTNVISETNHAITLTGLRSGAVYEYYIRSVNDVGLTHVDDNNANYYSFTRP